MRPPGRAALGLLLGLLLGLPRGASPKPTPCQRCRELVDKFYQVGRPRGPATPRGPGPSLPRGALGTPRCTWSPPPGTGT